MKRVNILQRTCILFTATNLKNIFKLKKMSYNIKEQLIKKSHSIDSLTINTSIHSDMKLWQFVKKIVLSASQFYQY